ncbi:MAG TPA: hypothetical protein VFA81_10920 [Burkholderiales bacterium]|nr:hypothetical protein [Burkholderiales bacterium]
MTQLALILDRVESKRLKREGMDLARVKNSAWMRERLFDLREYAAHTRRFPMEFFRAWCDQHHKPSPSSPKAWGAFAGYAVGQGVITPTGSFTPAASKKTHAHRVMIYESRVDPEPVPFAGYV